MEFYERYEGTCRKLGYKPQSAELIDRIGTTKSSVTSWKNKGFIPTGSTVASIADALDVSTDYLLCRTEDPTDYAKHPVEDMHEHVVHEEVPAAMRLYNKLDRDDQIRVEGIIQGLLFSDKYKVSK